VNVKYRAQILLEPEQHAILAEIVESENRSLSDLMREIVADWLKQHNEIEQRARELQALEKLTELRLRIQEEHGVYPTDLMVAIVVPLPYSEAARAKIAA
jgi:Arc/MetJ-type ribon-helix-helix transcriptional regulator